MNKSLRIAIVAPVWFAIPPLKYGGTELIIDLLSEELVRRGHDVTLFATGDSKTSAKLKSTTNTGVYDLMVQGKADNYEKFIDANIENMVKESENFDIVHLHLDLSKIPLTSSLTIPVIFTMHTAVSQEDILLLKNNTAVKITAISNSQIAIVPEEQKKKITVIYNTLNFNNVETLTSGTLKGSPYLLFLGRMGPQKNPLDAIKIAKQAGLPIILAGEPQNPTEKIYLKEVIIPLVDNINVKYAGSVDNSQKEELYKNAGALIFPITWQEPFGLVLIEAMSHGVPVLAYKKGSVEEIIEYGKTGFYAESADELAKLVPDALSLDRKFIQESTFKRFDYMKMVDQYLELYECLIKENKI